MGKSEWGMRKYKAMGSRYWVVGMWHRAWGAGHGAEDRGQKTEDRRRKTEAFEFGLRPVGAMGAYAPEGSRNAEI